MSVFRGSWCLLFLYHVMASMAQAHGCVQNATYLLALIVDMKGRGSLNPDAIRLQGFCMTEKTD